MPPQINLGRTADEQRTMLGHLITIGEATNGAWGSRGTPPGDDADLSDHIKGIGDRWEQELRAVGVNSVGDLAAMNEDQQRRIRSISGFPDVRLPRWIEQAKKVRRGEVSRDLPDEELYRRTVANNRNRFMDSNGVVEQVMWVERAAVVMKYDLFDAPANHAPSQELEAALRGIVAAADLPTGEHMLVPNLTAGHVQELRSAVAALAGGAPMNAASVARLNEALGPAGVDVVPELDQYAALPVSPREAPEPAEADRYADAPSGGQLYTPGPVRPASGQQDAPGPVPKPTAHYGQVVVKDPAYTTADDARRAGPGVREAGNHFRPARRHPTTELGEDDEDEQLVRPGRPGGQPGAETAEATEEQPDEEQADEEQADEGPAGGEAAVEPTGEGEDEE